MRVKQRISEETSPWRLEALWVVLAQDDTRAVHRTWSSSIFRAVFICKACSDSCRQAMGRRFNLPSLPEALAQNFLGAGRYHEISDLASTKRLTTPTETLLGPAGQGRTNERGRKEGGCEQKE